MLQACSQSLTAMAVGHVTDQSWQQQGVSQHLALPAGCFCVQSKCTQIGLSSHSSQAGKPTLSLVSWKQHNRVCVSEQVAGCCQHVTLMQSGQDQASAAQWAGVVLAQAQCTARQNTTKAFQQSTGTWAEQCLN